MDHTQQDKDRTGKIESTIIQMGNDIIRTQ